MLWFVKFLAYYGQEVQYFNNIGTILICSFFVELILFKLLVKKRRLQLFWNGDDFKIVIKEQVDVQIFDKVVFKNSWWSYNNITTDNFDKDSTDSQFDREGYTGRSSYLSMILFLECDMPDGDKLYLMEELEGYQELPVNWNYRMMDTSLHKLAFECYKLDIMRSKIQTV